MSVNQTYGLCEIKKMVIISHNDFELDVFGTYKSLNIYEDLFSPSITAQLTLEDASGVLNFLPIIGQEKVLISYVTQGLTEFTELEMIVNKITDLESSVGTQTYNLELVSADMITNLKKEYLNTLRAVLQKSQKSVLRDWNLKKHLNLSPVKISMTKKLES